MPAGAVSLSLMILAAGFATTAPAPGSECREPFLTAELVETAIAQWDEWTVASLSAFWPDSIEPLGPGTETELPNIYGSLTGEFGRCGELFTFTRASPGHAQFLDRVEVRYAAETYGDAELSGKAILTAFGKPFAFLGDAYDAWRPDDEGHFRRDYRWDDPKIHVSISIEKRDRLFHLSMGYDRETHLDRKPPSSPEAPLRIYVEAPDLERMLRYQAPCLRLDATVDRELTRKLAHLTSDALTERPDWFELVSREDAEFTLVVGGVWRDETRCVGVSLLIPGQHLSTEISEQGPDWRDLGSHEVGAQRLTDAVVRTFRDNLGRFRQLRP